MSVDLGTTYLGLHLAHPIVPSASPLAGDLDGLRALEAAGAPAVVLPSLFEEQIEHEEMEIHRLMEFGADSTGEATFGYFPELVDYNTGPGSYLELIEQAAGTLEIPVIASLNGRSSGGWTSYAKRMQDAGASALELNVYLVPTDPHETGEEVERRYVDLVAQVAESVDIPVAAKIGPYFSAMANMGVRLLEAGAEGLVIFNRYLMPDIDLDTLDVVPKLELSTPSELRLPLRWVAILRDAVNGSLALTSGVHTAEDALKAILVGSDAVMLASALLRNGPAYLGTVVDGVRAWLEEHEYRSVEQAKGSLSRGAAPTPEAFERSNYMQALVSYTGPSV